MDRLANNGDEVRSSTMKSIGCEQRLPHFFLKTRREKRNIKNSAKKSLSLVTPALFLFFLFFFFHIFGKRFELCRLLLFSSPPPSFDPPFTPVLFSFFFFSFHFLLSLSLSFRWFPHVKIDTRFFNVHYVRKLAVISHFLRGDRQ